MNKDDIYLEHFLTPIRICKKYKPKFGNSKKKDGYNYQEFNVLYSSDLFYAWLGLNSKLMYSAHKAAGGMTSIYRQIGIGCERLFRAVLMDSCEYTDQEFATWSYEAKTKAGQVKKLSLDGRLELSEIKNLEVLSKTKKWMSEYCSDLGIKATPSNGVVFEVRQGYKSKDSKRQNADIDNATVAWANGYLPVFAIFSSQIDGDVVLRYKNNRCGVLAGIQNGNKLNSLFDFSDKVLMYDLEGFFKRNENVIKKEIKQILEKLLEADGTT